MANLSVCGRNPEPNAPRVSRVDEPIPAAKSLHTERAARQIPERRTESPISGIAGYGGFLRGCVRRACRYASAEGRCSAGVPQRISDVPTHPVLCRGRLLCCDCSVSLATRAPAGGTQAARWHTPHFRAYDSGDSIFRMNSAVLSVPARLKRPRQKSDASARVTVLTRSSHDIVHWKPSDFRISSAPLLS